MGGYIEATWGPWDDSLQRAFHQAWFDPDRLEVILLDGEPVGVLDGYPSAPGVFYLARIELLPDVQGRGLGRQLINDILANARADGFTTVELDVLEENPGAQRLYERLGFRVVSADSPKRHMRLPLRPPPHPSFGKHGSH